MAWLSAYFNSILEAGEISCRSLPAKDVATRLLVHGANHFAADTFFFCFTTAEDAFVRRQNTDTQPVEHVGDVVDADVNPASRFAGPVDFLHDQLAVGTILEVDPQDVLRLLFDNFEVPDVAFALQGLGDADLNLRRGN